MPWSRLTLTCRAWGDTCDEHGIGSRGDTGQHHGLVCAGQPGGLRHGKDGRTQNGRIRREAGEFPPEAQDLQARVAGLLPTLGRGQAGARPSAAGVVVLVGVLLLMMRDMPVEALRHPAFQGRRLIVEVQRYGNLTIEMELED